MSLQLKKKGFIPFSFVVTSAAVVAAGFVLVSTYPHIKSVFLSFFRINNEELDHIEEIDVLEIEAGQPLMDVSKWSDEDLKIYLQEKDLIAPEELSHDDLVLLVKSIYG